MSWQPMDLAPQRDDLDALAITTLRMMSVDGVEAANSGHPGLPLGAAPMAWTLFRYFLRFNPSDPKDPLRDRFVLSAGHGSMLLYSLLHLFGYPVTVEDLRAFRKLGSITPGHPEFGVTAGVETSTGPLGQGIANACGMAIAAQMLHGKGAVAREDMPRVFAICSDGDLMEGISNEASSLAGHLGLGNLFVFYDNNAISIDGSTELAFTESRIERYRALGWRCVEITDGNSHQEIKRVLDEVLFEHVSMPTFISVRTIIGYGVPGRENTEKVHGAPLGPELTSQLKQRFGWPTESFYVPEEVRTLCADIVQEKAAELASARSRCPMEPRFEEFTQSRIDEVFSRVMSSFEPGKALATRVSSEKVLSQVVPALSSMVVGTADLAESTGMALKMEAFSQSDRSGRFIHYGVREHAMGAIMNGIHLFDERLRVAGSTFLVFSDYMRGAIRLSALMRIPVTYVFTHDSVGVGEDGPTHEPIEQINALRLIPHLEVFRPADAHETAVGWKMAVSRLKDPMALVLSRQALDDLGDVNIDQVERFGARVVHDGDGGLDLIIVATGSEVALALGVAKEIEQQMGLRNLRVVSMPSRDRFLSLSIQEREEILPRGVPSVSVEAGTPMGWMEVVREGGLVIGIEDFGHSGKGPLVMAEMGISVEKIYARVRDWFLSRS
jgi:transketolase